MNQPLIQISNEEVVREIHSLAALTGRSPAEVVAVHAELERTKHAMSKEERLRAVEEIVQRFNALPVVGKMLIDDDLYDENGLPR